MSDIPKIEKSSLVYEGYFNLKEDILKRSDKASLPYSFIETKNDAVVILAKTKDNRWIITKEYRHPIKQYITGIPGGAMEDGESPIQTAKRELLEETGYETQEFELLGTVASLPALCAQKAHFILASNVIKVSDQKLDPYEYIDVELLLESEIDKKIAMQENIDGIFCTAWLLYKLK